jgi:glycosyltransferase involved in cell wall biosynthesis
MAPLVSIGMSVYNCGSVLVPTIRSLLHQTYENWELILLDDGSSDGSLSAVRSFDDQRIRLLADGMNKGLGARLNQAVALSRGAYFARMDGGDVAYPERLALQVEFLKRHPWVDVAASRILIFSGRGRVVGSYPFFQTHEEICRRPWAGFQFPHPTWMGKIAWFRRHPYSSAMRKSQDQELLLRTYQRSCFESINHILLGYQKDGLSLRDLLRNRYYFSKALLSRAGQERNPLFMLGVLENAVKALIEIIYVTAGLNYRILRHRSVPVEKEEIVRWGQVWEGCNKGNV